MFQQAVLGKCESSMPPWHILIYIAFRSTLFTYLTLGSSLFFFFLKWWVGKLRKKIQEVKNSEPCQSIFLTVFSGLPWKWTWSRERQKKQKTLAPGQTDACLLLRSGQRSRVSAHAACLQDDFMSYCCFSWAMKDTSPGHRWLVPASHAFSSKILLHEDDWWMLREVWASPFQRLPWNWLN